MELDRETQIALVDELRELIRDDRQRAVHAVAKALGTRFQTEEPRLARLLTNKDARAIDQVLGPDRVEQVLDALCKELGRGRAEELIEAARRAVRSRPRPAPDRHPAWTDLGAAAPWVDAVPGLPSGLETIKSALAAYHAPEVLWLVGPPGSGKTAWLHRANLAGIGTLVTDPPDEPAAGTVFLVDDPQAPETWLAWANRWRVRLVITAVNAPSKAQGAQTILLEPWSRHELAAFVDCLRCAPVGRLPKLDAADLDAIKERIESMSGIATPLGLGNTLRLLVDEPDLASTTERELRIRVALQQIAARGLLPFSLAPIWRSHGRRAAERAASLAVRSARASDLAAAVSPVALEDELKAIAGPAMGGREGEALGATLERAKRASPKNPLKKLEEWAANPSAADLVQLLLQTGLWQRRDDGMLAVTDHDLAVMLAADALDEEWMWDRLLATLADPSWSSVRRHWAARLGLVEARIDLLLATASAVHAGAIELATALLAHASEPPRDDQIEQVIFSMVQLVLSVRVFQARLGLMRGGPADDLRIASRRHRRTLSALSTDWTASALASRGTAVTTKVIEALDDLAARGELWGNEELFSSGAPPWVTYASLLPWQALPLLREPSSRKVLLARSYPWSWEPVLIDHAADGDPWARAIATGDVDEENEDDCHAVAYLVSERAMLDALGRWPGPHLAARHQRAIEHALYAGRRDDAALDRRLRERAVLAVTRLVEAHLDLPLPEPEVLTAHERVWRESFERAGATRLVEAWFAAVRRRIDGGIDPASQPDWNDRSWSPFPAELSQLIPMAEQLVRIAHLLHRLGQPGALRGLLALPGRAHGTRQQQVEWALALGAAKVLLVLREAAPLRQALARERGGHGPAYEALGGDHDEETETWIAEEVEYRYQEFLTRIPGRRQRREIARRWARGTASHRRDAAATWLLEHGEDGEAECVLWLLRDEPIAGSRYRARSGLKHPDDRVRRAAAALLKRAIDQVGDRGALMDVAHCFYPGEGRDRYALMMMKEYLDDVNASDQRLSPDCLRALIRHLQAALADWPPDEAWAMDAICEAVAKAARGATRILSEWLRSPVGEASAVNAELSARVRHHIAAGLIGHHGCRGLDRDLLQVIAGWNDLLYSVPAHVQLLEDDAITVAQLEAEWGTASDTVLLEKDRAPMRWYAVQAVLQRRAPDRYASAFAERLLALPAELRRLGVLQISQVASFDARQAARLSALFD